MKDVTAGLAAVVAAALLGSLSAAPRYDLLLRGGHVIDPVSGLNAVSDVAVSGTRIASVATRIDPLDASKTIDASGLYVVPGIVDIHTHVYAGTGEKNSYAGDNSVYPDTFAPRTCVTTVVDAGGSGWRNFDDFKQRVIDRSATRVLAMLNIVGQGMRGGAYEQDQRDMAAQTTAEKARAHPGLIVGIKTAHYSGPEWTPVEQAVAAGNLAGLPVMVDFGAHRAERPLTELLTTKLRPGDIYTHVYSGLRGEQDPDGHVSAALINGRKRGVLFDVGHGARSLAWRIVEPALKEGFGPDTISSDLHVESMSGGMKDMLNVMSKFIALGMPLEEVVMRTTARPAAAIKQPALGRLAVGAGADIAVLRVERGTFGFVDADGIRRDGTQRLACELTVRDGKVIHDMNGLSAKR